MLEPSTSILAIPQALPRIPPNIFRAIELGAFPAIGMNLVTLLGLRFPTPDKVVGALQHFSAGILLTTIAKELFPEMVKAQGVWENLASGVGFFAGVGVLILLGILLPEEETEDAIEGASMKIAIEEKDKDPTAVAKSVSLPHTKTQASLRNRRKSLKSEAFASVSKDLATIDNGLDIAVAALPTALLAAIAIDSALDGLLIGISTAVDPKTGPLLSASLTVESSFLGLTVAAALRGKSAPQTLLILASALAPVGIVAGSISGGGLAPLLANNPVLYIGCLGFGTSTTLFMVAEELLLQAHEEESEHTWWVDLQLYTGFFASVMIEKLFGL